MLPIPPDYIPLAELFTGWWRGLQSLDKNGAERKIAGQVLPPNRKALAQLRRVNIEEGTAIPAIDIVTALTIDEFWDLIGRLKASDKLSKEIRTWIDQNDWEPFAIAAATLARVRLDTNSPHKPGSTAKMLGTPRNPEPGSKTIFYALAEMGSRTPRSLAAAFLKPVGHGANDFGAASKNQLEELRAKFDSAYGQCWTKNACLDMFGDAGPANNLAALKALAREAVDAVPV
jgi:hypothetical protein